MDQTESHDIVLACGIVKLLHGMPLNRARYVLGQAKILLLQANYVDAASPELSRLLQQFSSVG